mmetsp:Transcript_1065/g.1187  ORF Transcript_1065/g.1187 Transcript_1065/m.1187 type:complete len:888 (-) Transcript_1065:21-2684(-)
MSELNLDGECYSEGNDINRTGSIENNHNGNYNNHIEKNENNYIEKISYNAEDEYNNKINLNHENGYKEYTGSEDVKDDNNNEYKNYLKKNYKYIGNEDGYYYNENPAEGQISPKTNQNASYNSQNGQNNGQNNNYIDGNEYDNEHDGSQVNLSKNLPFSTQQQIEEERLRGDILKYLVGNSNGTYHYSADLRAIIHDVIGIPVNSTQTELSETVASLLDILHTDPEKRFLVSGEGDNIHIKRCFVRGDEDEISDLVEEWRALIATFLLDSKRSVGLSDIGSSVPRPVRIPTSVKLIFIMKTDPSNRFILKGDGNAAKARYNMQADSFQETVWIDRWTDDIAIFLTKQQWAMPSVGLHEIGTHVVRPFFLPPRVKLLETLQADLKQRFLIIGFGNDTRVMMRDFRGDEPEIGEAVEHWRLLIASYLGSKKALPGGAQPLLGLSEIGTNVQRPADVPCSVKLIDIMRVDPMCRFILKGEGNALRVKISQKGIEFLQGIDPNDLKYMGGGDEFDRAYMQNMNNQNNHERGDFRGGGYREQNISRGNSYERGLTPPRDRDRDPYPKNPDRGQYQYQGGGHDAQYSPQYDPRGRQHLQQQVQQFHQRTNQGVSGGGAGGMVKRHSEMNFSEMNGNRESQGDWNNAGTLSLDRRDRRDGPDRGPDPNRDRSLYPPVYAENTPQFFNGSTSYGTSFGSQRTSSETGSTYTGNKSNEDGVQPRRGVEGGTLNRAFSSFTTGDQRPPHPRSGSLLPESINRSFSSDIYIGEEHRSFAGLDTKNPTISLPSSPPNDSSYLGYGLFPQPGEGAFVSSRESQGDWNNAASAGTLSLERRDRREGPAGDGSLMSKKSGSFGGLGSFSYDNSNANEDPFRDGLSPRQMGDGGFEGGYGLGT